MDFRTVRRVALSLAVSAGLLVPECPRSRRMLRRVRRRSFKALSTSGTGNPVAGATVSLTGASTATTTTDTNGTFSVTVVARHLPASTSRAAVYVAAVLSDLAVTAGSTVPVTVSLNQANLSSLQTIGRVSTVSRGSASAINTGTATSSYLSGQAFTNLANPQINDVLQPLARRHDPAHGQPTGYVDHRRRGPAVRNAGAGRRSPARAGPVRRVGEPVLPLVFDRRRRDAVGTRQHDAVREHCGRRHGQLAHAELHAPADLRAHHRRRQLPHPVHAMLTTGSAGKLQYVIGAGTDGYNGPFYQAKQCDVTPEGANTGIIQFCGDSSGSFSARVSCSSCATSLRTRRRWKPDFVGAWGGYSPQGTAWGTSLGPLTIVGCTNPNGPNTGICTNPKFSNMVGSTVNSLGWYPGSYIYNNQTLFDAQFRTAIGNDTLLVRPYVGSIEPEIIIGMGEIYYPAGFSPVNAPNDAAFQTACGNAFGSTTNPPAVPPSSTVRRNASTARTRRSNKTSCTELRSPTSIRSATACSASTTISTARARSRTSTTRRACRSRSRPIATRRSRSPATCI